MISISNLKPPANVLPATPGAPGMLTTVMDHRYEAHSLPFGGGSMHSIPFNLGLVRIDYTKTQSLAENWVSSLATKSREDTI